MTGQSIFTINFLKTTNTILSEYIANPKYVHFIQRFITKVIYDVDMRVKINRI